MPEPTDLSPHQDAVIYAIGDIHGELDMLAELHAQIDTQHSVFHAGVPQLRVHLGDYIDRGPDSAGVVDFIRHLTDHAPYPVLNLKGNHEAMLHDAVTKGGRAAEFWLEHGGEQTLESYARAGRDPREDAEWLTALPSAYILGERKLVFVHAGIDPRTFPHTDLAEVVHLWTRKISFFESQFWTNPALDGVRVIHGHTPTQDNTADISSDGRRINVDTGAVYGGALSACVLAPGAAPGFLSVRA